MQQLFMRRLLGASGDLHGLYEWTTYGTYTFKLSRKTKVKMIIVGSGQDSHKNIMTFYGTSTTYYAGSGGAVFIGGVVLPAGSYTATINHSTEIDNPNVQPHPSMCEPGSTMASAGSVILSNQNGLLISVNNYITKTSNFETIYGTVETEVNGNSASDTTGGASLYNGYGKGSDAQTHNNTSGYFKIEW